jgi:glycosyltransferase involved in cell wall biosynthesis
LELFIRRIKKGKNMKICYIADANSPHSQRWIGYFVEKGHQIDWISCSAPEGDLPDGVKFHKIKDSRLKALKIVKNAIAVRRLVKKINPDILHAHYAGVNGVLGWFCNFHPYIITAWGSDILVAAQKPAIKILIKKALASASVVTSDALHLKDEMIKLGLSKNKIEIINFGVETDVFRPGTADFGLQKKLRIQNIPSIISVRSLEPIYDVSTLLEAVAMVIGRIPAVKFIIGGRGSYGSKLKDQAKDLGIEGNVIFVGFIPHGELYRWFRSVDVYVSTSLSDAGIAASTAEAMACGLPAVISATAENNKWIESNRNGFLFPAKNANKLAEILIRLISNAELCRKIGIAGRQTIIEKNDYGNEMAKMEKLYEKLGSINK